MNYGILYLIATPIGNREDITIRAVKTLGEVDLLLCEDTRRTGLLIQWIDEKIKNLEFIIKNLSFKKPSLVSFHEHNEKQRVPQVIELLKTGKKIGLVSNAGTPTISDPGFKLVHECLAQKIQVVSIPGPSSFLTALTSSGLPTDRFLFLGYLPKKSGKRKNLLSHLYYCTSTLVQDHLTAIFFESPYRLTESLIDLREIFGDVEIVICRELTKLYEETKKEKISRSLEYFSHTPPRGEFTVLFEIEKKRK